MTDRSKCSDYEWRSGRQYSAAIIGNLVMLSHGCILGWFSPALPTLMSENTPLTITGPLTSSEISNIGSISNIGALCGTFMFGFITSRLGCKRAMLFLAIPSIIFWVLVFFGNSYYYILIARFFTGWTGGGASIATQIYISEISNDNLRGRLSAIIQLARNSGILIAYIVGAVADYEHIPCIFVSLPVLYVISFLWVPNTPKYYLNKNLIQEAQDALKYYKSYGGKTEHEINVFNVEFERLKSIAQEQQADEQIHISDFTNRKAMKGLIIGLALAYFSQLTGVFTIITYSVFIFDRTETDLNPYKSSIAIAVMLIMGNFCTTQLADKLGRKTWLIASLLGCALGLICLSIFLYLNKNGYDLKSYSLIPVICLAFVVFVASAGIIPLSHVCRVENLPSKIRTIGLTICISALTLTSYACTKLFPLLIETIELYGSFTIFSINCVIGAAFIYFFVDETRGTPMDTLKETEKNEHEVTKC